MEESMMPLPDCARAKLESLEQSAADAAALAASALAKADVLRQQIGDLQQQRNAHPNAADSITAEIARKEGELESTRETQRRRQARVANDRQLIAQIDSWLQGLPRGAALEPVQPVDLNGEGRDDVADSLADVRRRITDLKAELKALRTQPLPHEELRARAREYVARLAEQARPTLTGVRGEGAFGIDLGPDARGPLVTLAWVARDLLLERIESMFPPEGVADKAERLAAVEEELLEMERDEETLVTRAIEQGQDVYRRPKADPRAVLGVRIAERSTKAAA
jgi:hypothetical protein